MTKQAIAQLSELEDRVPAHALVGGVDREVAELAGISFGGVGHE